MKIYLTILTFCIATSLRGQNFYSRKYEKNYVAYGVGMAGYYGDLQHQLIIPNQAFTVELSHRLSHHLKIRESLALYWIHAKDEKQTDSELVERNLSFESNNVELAVILELRMFKTYTKGRVNLFNPYVFLGIGITTVNPTTKLNGNKYKLRKYQTEGVHYKGLSQTFPMGLGLEIAFTKRLSLFSEFGVRFTGNDYLDDVSSVYVDIQPHETTRYMLADRSSELGLSKKSVGQTRGGKGNDVYAMLMFKLQFLLPRDFFGKHKNF